jgi:hypothetical protein
MRALSYGDERWLSFHDNTNLYGDENLHPASKHTPFRIIRVREGCTYQTQYDLDRQAGL